ncbi:energy transducer TonB [Sphingomonas sp.]|uniref:energy transducer TonB n=1 Tax=Sphingomonas sp. TaxID=28214 RepID=UPI003341CDBF
MYADRYSNRRGLDPAGVTLSLAMCGVIAFGLTLATPNIARHVTTILIGEPIPLTPDPPPIDPPKPQPQTKTLKPIPTQQRDPVDLTTPTVTPAAGAETGPLIDLPPTNTLTVGTGIDIGTIIPPHTPVLRDPTLDSRFIDAFQPAYPSDMRLGEREGRVVVRVLIGIDGRVKDVEQVSAASPSFFDATRKQALTKWRFKPGTRDGVAIEAWHMMAVRFVLDEG